MKTQTHLKTLIAVAVTGLLLTGAANAQTGYQSGRHDNGPAPVQSQPRYDDHRNDRGDNRHDYRNDNRNDSGNLRYDRAIVLQVNDVRAQIDHANRRHQIGRRDASRFQDRLDRIIALKRSYARSDMGLNRCVFDEVTGKLSDLSADVTRGDSHRRY